jgi:hypothetical protein
MRIVLISILLFLFFNGCAQQSKKQELMNRNAAVAGRFYPANKNDLLNDVKYYFSSAKSRKADAIAVISPHAGYVFSGQISASAINQINPDKKYENVFIIAASHTTYFDGASIYSAGNYLTPLGEVKVNIDLANKLINENDFFKFLPEAHKTEHSIEVQLPFLQVHLKNDFQIIPIVIGQDAINTAKKIAKVLKPYFNEKNIFVISSDFSHYPSYDDALRIDNETAEAIISGKPDSLINLISKYEKSKVNNLATTCCGWSAVLTLMYLTDNNFTYLPIDYKNSGDSPYGSKDKVVGYWAISVIKNQNNDFSLSDEEKIELLKLARITIEEKINNNKRPDISSLKITDNLKNQCGAFVTLHKNGALRGCIGQFEPKIPLYEVVIDMAISAATRDPRFSPVTKNELDEIDIEISVLTPMKKISSIDEIELGKHGIYIMKNGRGGTFLPQVATETGWSLEEFLGHCARDKAGIGWTGWKDADIYTYEAIVFSEKDFGLFPKKKTKYYTKIENSKIRCELCPHKCILEKDEVGICNARKNINGELESLSYGKIVALHNDPVEKKPLYHFMPETYTMSLGTAGCNFSCKNCQNYQISQASPLEIEYTSASPQQIVEVALKYNSKSISYTYTEPTVFYEFMLETAKLAHAAGLKNIMVSNGYINKEPLLELIPYLDAANIDLKCFDNKLYRQITGGSLQPVLETILLLKKHNVWVEITNLIIPGYTDDMEMISKMCDWMVENNLQDVPLHFSRFFSAYKLSDVPPTPVETVEKAAEIAKSKGIKYVYLGNVRNSEINTYCPKCGEILIRRIGYNSQSSKDFKGKCPKCAEKISGVW